MIGIEKADVLGLAAAVHAAVSSGLLELVVEGPLDPREAAARVKVDATAAARVLDVLVGAGLLTQAQGRYALDAELAAMHSAFPGGLGLTAMLFSTTPAFLASGAPVVAMDGEPGERADAYRATVGGLGVLFERAAGEFARAFAAAHALGAAPRVLDVGCGSGVWGLSLAAALPGARLTGLDLPKVAEVFRATARARGQAVDVVEADMREAALPTSDVVLLANVLRLEPDERAAALVRRLADAVAPGGALVIIDALAGGTPEREVARAVYALHLSLRTRQASVHAPSRVTQWLGEAGLTRVTPLDFGVWPGAVAALVGWR